MLRPVWLTDKLSEEVELTKKGELYKGTETSRASLAGSVGICQPDTDGAKPAAYR